MKRKYYILIFAIAILAVLLLLCGCNQTLEDRLEQMSTSIDSATQSTVLVEMKDGETLVYSVQDVTTLDKKNSIATIKTTEQKLGEDFTMRQSTSTRSEIRSVVEGIKITVSDVVFSQLKEDSLTCVISKDNARNVFGSDIQTNSDITVTCNFVGDKLDTVKCEFSSPSKKNVTISYVYGY